MIKGSSCFTLQVLTRASFAGFSFQSGLGRFGQRHGNPVWSPNIFLFEKRETFLRNEKHEMVFSATYDTSLWDVLGNRGKNG
jgi:hypothetical protein